MSQLALPSTVPNPLPDIDDLDRRFREFNELYFRGTLPPSKIRWSDRMRIAGTCHRHRQLITLSRPYHERFPEDIDDTLKHEMIHLKYAGHGPAFKREAKRIGASLHCRSYEGLHPRSNLIYVCLTCLREYRRMKPAELFCGRCARKQPLQSSLLVLKSPQSKPYSRSRAAQSCGMETLPLFSSSL